MEASIKNPKYRCTIKTKSGIYNVSDILTGLTITENKDDLARGAILMIPNLKDHKKYIYNYVKVRDSVFISCDTGKGYEEIFRGTIWDLNYVSDKIKDFTMIAYDRLIYLQNTKDNFFFAKGKSTKSILKTICKRWGVKLDFQYESITHRRKIIREVCVSDAILEILEEVRKKTGTKYVISFEKGIMTIRKRGQNKKIYRIDSKESALKETTKVTMNGMITKVAIYREQEMQGAKEMPPKRVTVVKGDTKTYGTLQEILIREPDDTKSVQAKKEARDLIKDYGKPQYERTLEAVNHPYVRKGDKIRSNAGALEGYYTVIGAEHDCLKGVMVLEVEK